MQANERPETEWKAPNVRRGVFSKRNAWKVWIKLLKIFSLSSLRVFFRVIYRRAVYLSYMMTLEKQISGDKSYIGFSILSLGKNSDQLTQ